MKLLHGAASAALAAAVALLAAPVNDAGKRWWSHIEIMAADDMEGRDTGSPGHLKAARYVSGEFERAGLKAAGTKGYLQPVEFEVRKIDEPTSSLEIVRTGNARTLELGEDAVISMRTPPADSLDAPLYFAGYGFTVPEMKYDDLSGKELRGKVIVTIQGAPKNIPGPLRAHYQSAAERRVFLDRAGVVGNVGIPNPKVMEIPWARLKLSRFMPAMSLSDPSLTDAGNMKLGVMANPDRAAVWFDGSGHTLAELLALADAGKPLPRFPLVGNLRSRVKVQRSHVESQNVAGIFEGSDPKLKKEYVVLSAHLDHVGVGEPVNGDRIYNGAMDNASGVATLIEIARSLQASKIKPRRSVLFVAVTGEEKGLLGSKYFASLPTVPVSSLVTNLNFDMFLPIYPLHIVTAYGLRDSDLGDVLTSVAGKAGVQVQEDQEPDRNLFIRSDQYNFIRRGVPSLYLKFGYLKGSPEEKLTREWLRNRYHAPSDDLKQPVDIQAATQFNDLMLKIVEVVANQDQRPRWKDDSFFKRFAR